MNTCFVCDRPVQYLFAYPQDRSYYACYKHEPTLGSTNWVNMNPLEAKCAALLLGLGFFDIHDLDTNHWYSMSGRRNPKQGSFLTRRPQ